MAEREADRRARRLCLCELEGLQEQFGRIGFAEQVLRKADLGQQLGSDSWRGRLGERLAQTPDGAVQAPRACAARAAARSVTTVCGSPCGSAASRWTAACSGSPASSSAARRRIVARSFAGVSW